MSINLIVAIQLSIQLVTLQATDFVNEDHVCYTELQQFVIDFDDRKLSPVCYEVVAKQYNPEFDLGDY